MCNNSSYPLALGHHNMDSICSHHPYSSHPYRNMDHSFRMAHHRNICNNNNILRRSCSSLQCMCNNSNYPLALGHYNMDSICSHHPCSSHPYRNMDRSYCMAHHRNICNNNNILRRPCNSLHHMCNNSSYPLALRPSCLHNTYFSWLMAYNRYSLLGRLLFYRNICNNSSILWLLCSTCSHHRIRNNSTFGQPYQSGNSHSIRIYHPSYSSHQSYSNHHTWHSQSFLGHHNMDSICSHHPYSSHPYRNMDHSFRMAHHRNICNNNNILRRSCSSLQCMCNNSSYPLALGHHNMDSICSHHPCSSHPYRNMDRSYCMAHHRNICNNNNILRRPCNSLHHMCNNSSYPLALRPSCLHNT